MRSQTNPEPATLRLALARASQKSAAWPGRNIGQSIRVAHNREAITLAFTTRRNGCPWLVSQSLGLRFAFSFRPNTLLQVIQRTHFIVLLTLVTFRAIMHGVRFAAFRLPRGERPSSRVLARFP